MVSQPLPNPEQSDADQLEAAADQAIAACGGESPVSLTRDDVAPLTHGLSPVPGAEGSSFGSGGPRNRYGPSLDREHDCLHRGR
jgi:hypothetical protein